MRRIRPLLRISFHTFKAKAFRPTAGRYRGISNGLWKALWISYATPADANEYFCGGKGFELPELKLLVDAVQASRFVSHKKNMKNLNSKPIDVQRLRAHFMKYGNGAQDTVQSIRQAGAEGQKGDALVRFFCSGDHPAGMSKPQAHEGCGMENNICISFYLREAAIRIHRRTLNSINNPSFVEFLINNEQKTFAVRACGKKSLTAFHVRENIDSKTDKVEFYSLPLCLILARLNNWDENGSYRVFGKAYPEQGVVALDFSNSEAINENGAEGDGL